VYLEKLLRPRSFRGGSGLELFPVTLAIQIKEGIPIGMIPGHENLLTERNLNMSRSVSKGIE